MTGHGVQLKVKVVPAASKDEIKGWLGNRLKIRVSAPPEKGRANRAVLKLLASRLDLPVSRLSVVDGETSSLKTIAIEGLTGDQLDEIINNMQGKV